MRRCNCSKIGAVLAVLVVLFSLLGQSAEAETGKQLQKNRLDKSKGGLLRGPGVKFVEVEIAVSEQFDVGYISGLPRAPGNEPEVLGGSGRVKVQLPAGEVKALVEAGAEVDVVRRFVLIEGFAGEGDSLGGDVGTQAVCQGVYFYKETGENVYIPDTGQRVYSPIVIWELPPVSVVTCIDIQYYIIHSYVSDLVVELSNQADNIQYLLWEYGGGSGDYIYETVTGITVFNGEPANQMWLLWARDDYFLDNGHIESWWIKVYYDDGQPHYCNASGDNCWPDIYISRVQVGDIDNTSGCENYADFTSLSTEMEIGTGYPITVDNGDFYDNQDQCGIWVDWNRDFDFYDAGETISVSGTPGYGPYTATITPPEGASVGDTRMRIRVRHAGSLDPCGDTPWGEVEDYTITVASSTPTFKISGHVKLSDDSPLSGVLLTSSPGGVTDISDASGYYEITLTGPWTGHIDAQKDHYGFSWPTQFTDITTDQTQNFSAYYTYSGGFGISGQPYLIATPEDMNAIGTHTEDWDKYFKMVADIDMSDYTGTQFNIIGNDSNAFTGVFDGNDHTISNFTYRAINESYIGLFGYIDSPSAEIKNLGLIDPNVMCDAVVGNRRLGSLIGDIRQGTITNCYAKNCNASTLYHITGGLVGFSEGEIIDCYSSGVVSGDNSVGGLIGYQGNSATSSGCYSNTIVSGSDNVGGLVGSLNNGTISGCDSNAIVSGSDDVGGLVGQVSAGEVFESYSIGSVSGNSTVGGLVGYLTSSGTISSCYSKSIVSVSVGDDAGGLVGEIYYGTISNCYATGSVFGRYAAGLVGENDCGGIISNCYSIGYVSKDYVGGGLVASNGGCLSPPSQCIASFWDTETSGWGWSRQGTGKTTAEMQTQSTFTDAGWDFTTPVWKMGACGGYPQLWWETVKYGGGQGTSGEPYLICTAEQMQAIGADPNYWDKHFKLMADIDLGGYTGTEFNIIGIWPSPDIFRGTFDGNGHIIYNFTYETSGEYGIGLFGVVGGSDVEAEIKNLTLVDPNVDVGSGGDAGAIVGLWQQVGTLSDCAVIGGSVKGYGGVSGLLGSNMFGNVRRCFSSADVTATATEYGPAGGLISINNFGTVSQCYSAGNVTSNNIAGGLIGVTGSGSSTIDCYSLAEVTGPNFVGGLVAYSGSPIINCYSAGSVSGAGIYVGGLVGATSSGEPITSSFWDTETSGCSEPWPGTGLGTVEMQTQSTFTDAGWDFVGELVNGPNDVWKICEGTNYPKFAWQIPLVGDFVCPDGVETRDLAVLCEQWLLEELSWDVGPGGGDGLVNFLDWPVFANGWYNTTGMDDLAEFSEQWMQPSAYCADIAPEPDGDGFVDGLDFARFADNWLAGVGP